MLSVEGSPGVQRLLWPIVSGGHWFVVMLDLERVEDDPTDAVLYVFDSVKDHAKVSTCPPGPS